MLNVLWTIVAITAGGIVVVFLLLLVLLVVLMVLPLRYQGRAVLARHLLFSASVDLWQLAGFSVSYEDGILQRRLVILGFVKTFPWSPKTKSRDDSTSEAQPKAADSVNDPLNEETVRKPSAGESWTVEKGILTLQTARDILDIIRPSYLNISGKLGLFEPHQTGYAFMALLPLRQIHGAHITLQPIWDEEICDMEIQVGGRFIPLLLVTRIIRYALSPPMRQHWLKKIRHSRKSQQPGGVKAGSM